MQDLPPFHGRIFGGGGVGGAAATGRGGGLVCYPTLPSRQDQPSLPPVKCPRCDSTNTKFCYYNNYNLSQPRHFCKACRRYWTMGGVLRNVPVGGGCRKSKRPSKFTSPTSSNKNPSRRRNPLSAVRSSVDDSTAAGSATSDPSTSEPLPDPSLLASQICVPNHNPQLGKITNADLPLPAPNIFETQSAGGFATTPSPLLGFIFPDPSTERDKAEAAVIGPGFADRAVPVDRQPAGSSGCLPSPYWDGPVEPTLFDLTGTVDPSSYWNQSHWSDADAQYLQRLGD
ncbi:hypothetical protein ZIOFF_057960 [Zingiber officinale]|uniref:Dof zinc finger protein n=1 Tax=Zingiber officinale TaxID=94328 RepID=A0A8J5F5Q9_ZINOF|nr:hypothetical protein ZIOFF_057960 [Zingiber officinale]